MDNDAAKCMRDTVKNPSLTMSDGLSPLFQYGRGSELGKTRKLHQHITSE